MDLDFSIEKLMRWFINHNLKLAFAESCTGGKMASLVTSLPGSSAYFLGSFVVYSNEMKEKILEVKKETLQLKGAVSKEVVEEMCEGVFRQTSADYAIAVSGIAGPEGGSPKLPVGTIWAAIGKRGEVADTGSFLCQGNREEIIQFASYSLLKNLWVKVQKL